MKGPKGTTKKAGVSSTEEEIWLSRDMAALEEDLKGSRGKGPFDFDVLIIGSGYGGSIAAHELIGYRGGDGKPLRIGMLERGKEYVQGMFPATLAELPGHVRLDSTVMKKSVGNRSGLFDLRVSDDIAVVQANGLGGGSLINAGVMATPNSSVFETGWPDEVAWQEDLQPFYRDTRLLLGSRLPSRPQEKPERDNNISLADVIPQKTAFFEKASRTSTIASDRFQYAPVTVAMEKQSSNADTTRVSAVEYTPCIMCGDCATGCNHGAKKSLDNQLLAKCTGHMQIYSGVTVLKIERGEGKRHPLWKVHTTYTDEILQKRHAAPTVVRTRFLVLAAGTLGSTGLLLQSQSENLKFSPRLGKRFSGNGDALAVGYAHNAPVNAVAEESSTPRERKIGPTITGILELSASETSSPMVIEELAVPGPLKRIFEEVFTTTNLAHQLAEADGDYHYDGPLEPDPIAINPAAIRNTSVFAAMGDDGAAGEMHLGARNDRSEPLVNICWPDLRDHPLFDAQMQRLEQLAKSAGVDGRILANPLWQLLPASLMPLLGGKKGLPLTVHPLGGCSMGNDVRKGVVDQHGKVFNAAGNENNEFHAGLAVLDGSIIPKSLGINPALTIAAVSLRAIRALAKEWGLKCEERPPVPAVQRPIYRDVSQPRFPPTATEAEFIERLYGDVALRDAFGNSVTKTVEITLHYEPKVISELFSASGNHHNKTMQVIQNPLKKNLPHSVSKLRIFDPKTYKDANMSYLESRQLEIELGKCAEFEFAIRGSLTIMSRQRSTPRSRKIRATYAWFLNRGARDIWQFVAGKIRGDGEESDYHISPADVLKLASRAGERRLLQYDLQILGPTTAGAEKEDTGNFVNEFFRNQKFSGTKTITYARRSNPLLQLTELKLKQFPRMIAQKPEPLIEMFKAKPDDDINVLKLSQDFLVKKNLPLFRIIKQQDEPSALVDTASLGMYFFRLFLSIHLWAFRKPDRAPPRAINRLAGKVKGLPEPEIKWLAVGRYKSGIGRDRIRLARYARTNSQYPPVLLIHGYSASSTTFAHDALNSSLAKHLWSLGRDVWLVDLRTSSGLQTATKAWTFDEIAENDVPIAVKYVYERAGFKPIDVVAHCVGAALFSMAVLGPTMKTRKNELREACDAQTNMPKMVRRAVLSQLGPTVVFSASNTLRMFILGYLLPYFDLSNYEFQVKPGISTAWQLFDRLLSILPYPEEEFDIENPLKPWRRTPFAGSRHRMDALYGRTFSLVNLPRKVLDNIDDFFGPLNIDTLSQVMFFSKANVVTDKTGKNKYLSRNTLASQWQFATLHIQGEDNGLADISTSRLIKDVFSANPNFTSRKFPGIGHQDSLIGSKAGEVFAEIASFLSQPSRNDPNVARTEHATVAQIQPTTQGPAYIISFPQCGPIFEHPEENNLPIRFSVPASKGIPEYVAICSFNRDAHGDIDVKNITSANLRVFSPCTSNIETWFKVTLDLRQYSPADNFCLFLLYDPINSTHKSKFNIWSRLSRSKEKNVVYDAKINKLTILNNEAESEIILDCVNKKIEEMKQHLQPYLLDLKLCNSAARHTQNGVSFTLGSCQYPAGILYPTLAYRSFNNLGLRLRDKVGDKPSFAIFAGDQVYVDATAGLFDPQSQYETYTKKYEELYSNDNVREILRQLPSYNLLDDHEIDNNWQRLNEIPGNFDRANKRKRNQALLYRGVNAFLKYQRGDSNIYITRRRHNGNTRLRKRSGNFRIWYKFNVEGFSFFMSDTRTEREERPATTSDWKIMSRSQFYLLKAHLKKAGKENRPAFVVSPSIFLPRHRKDIDALAYSPINSDSWDGYPHSQTALLEYLVDNEIRNIIFLSGDEHLSCIAKAVIKRSDGKSVSIYSIHASALHAPFPFANSKKADLVQHEKFCWDGSGGYKYSCKVDAVFAEDGNGFAMLDLQNAGDGKSEEWTLLCEFIRDATKSPGAYSDFDDLIESNKVYDANFIRLTL